MKRLFYLMAIVSFASCTNDEEMNLLTENLPEESVSVEKRSFQEALEVAQGAPEIFAGTTTRGELKQVTLANTQYIISETSTRSESPDTLMYVFNYEDNQGYAVVSANKNTEALIAVTEQGTYNEDTEIDNPGLALYMDMAKEYIVTSGGTGVDNNFDELYEHKFEAFRDTFYTGPFVTVKWGQGAPYNENCPMDNGVRCPTGCVATALAQILSYYEYDGNIMGNTYNWTELKQHQRSLILDACSDTNHNNLARLFRDIGDGVMMDYGANGSGSSIYKASHFLSNLAFPIDESSLFSQIKINNELWNERVLYIEGRNDEDKGHVWVLDGMMDIRVISNEYVRPFGRLLWELVESITTHTYYNHFNWGFDGYNNGYFLSNVFDVTQAAVFDNDYSTIFEREYQNNVKIITNIKMPFLRN